MKYYIQVLKNYAVFDGRARRSEYWYFTLFTVIISIILSLIDELAGTDYLNTLYSLAVLIPSIAVSVRRMHDVGISGWFCLIPVYNFILACTAGDKGENKYGPDPKSDGISFDFEENQPSDLPIA